ncbi:MAG: hypothetical protein LBB73_00535 [Dysgonamonadaceae bacterium]|nr:hypothetical protein [Dysgonamonadaceae bacterium]
MLALGMAAACPENDTQGQGTDNSDEQDLELRGTKWKPANIRNLATGTIAG